MIRLAAATLAICTLFLQISSITAQETKKVSMPLTEAERQTFTDEWQSLQNQLDALRREKQLPQDRWADAQLFLKAVGTALEFGPIDNEKNRTYVQTALRRARERIELLSKGQTPWCERNGRTIRGYVSSVDDSVQPYSVVVPANYDKSKPSRLDVVLHGSTNATGIGELMYVVFSDGGDGEGPAPQNNFIELHPMGRLGENSYRFEGETDVDEAIEAVCRDYLIDRSRIVLRGSSLGGVGTWQLGLKRPDRYVALGPVAGPVDTIEFANSPWKHFVRLDPLTPWQKTTLHMVDAIDYAANGGMVPVVATMGDQDPYYATHLQMEQAFEKEGVPFVGLIDRGAGHGVTAKAMEEHLRRLGEYAAKGLDPFPKKIRFVTWSLRFNHCHWIEVLSLGRHYERAEIEAAVGDDGSIEIKQPRNITRFALYPPAIKAQPVALTVGPIRIQLPSAKEGAVQPVVIERTPEGWRYQGTLDEAHLIGKRPKLQGPIDDAFSHRFLCVRGTGTAWNSKVGEWADAQLKRFEYEWRRHFRGVLPVKLDTEVTEADIRDANLILFGDPGSNSWIQKVLLSLPITWTRETLQLGKQSYSAADHGIQMIHPNPLSGTSNRYVVLNSGHTYHDAELRFSYMVFPRLGDWAIVKTGENQPAAADHAVAETVLNSGFFDENWQTDLSQ